MEKFRIDNNAVERLDGFESFLTVKYNYMNTLVFRISGSQKSQMNQQLA